MVYSGAAASSMMMMLPPTSARKAVRQRNAGSITALSGVYGFLISTWISSRVNEKRDGEYVSKKDVVPAEWAREFRIMLIALAQGMQGIRELTELAKWEGSLRGAWPAEEYTKLADAQIEMIASLAQVSNCVALLVYLLTGIQLGGALDNLEGGWRLTFLHGTKVLNPHFVRFFWYLFPWVYVMRPAITHLDCRCHVGFLVDFPIPEYWRADAPGPTTDPPRPIVLPPSSEHCLWSQ